MRIPVGRPAVTRAVTIATLVALAVAPLGVPDFYLSVAARTFALGVLAVSVSVLTGHLGLPTLGQVGPFAVGSYTMALLSMAGTTVGPLQVLAAAGTSAIFAAATAPAIVWARGVTVLMITLAIGELTTTAAAQWTSLTGGTDGLAAIPPVRPFWGAPGMISDRATYWYVLVVASVAITVTVVVLRGPAGRLLAGSRDYEARMRASGHPVTRYLFVTCVAAGALAGIGGALLTTTQRYVSPSDVAFDTSALILLAVVIGGTTSVAGALVGTAVVVTGRDWLSDQWPGHGPMLLGALLLVAVYLLPQGIAGVGPWLSGLRKAKT
ncbi:branched-chain amino acid ABC transporter permease [Actinocrispum wychmicini]|uniref:Branched-chain amino acid transport system permease protein n=1 Tax=Actinocrispum wychmicini TaxID=1213861 RepID=A0A4R2JBH5_9PSEU|nr:branched-chain amino acid ABC transporter permease [Actinocrispum wychmicini]TCO54048.1 branched-chain amino acid transport system permease protein [Actinocrispum wychmicini]